MYKLKHLDHHLLFSQAQGTARETKQLGRKPIWYASVTGGSLFLCATQNSPLIPRGIALLTSRQGPYSKVRILSTVPVPPPFQTRRVIALGTELCRWHVAKLELAERMGGLRSLATDTARSWEHLETWGCQGAVFSGSLWDHFLHCP